MFATKVLTSRACEIASVDELNLDLQERDSEFVALCKEFIGNLRKIEEIIPFKRCWTPSGYNLIGFVVSLDGGWPGLGCTVHSLAEKNSEEGKDDANTGEKPGNTVKMEPEERTEAPNLFFLDYQRMKPMEVEKVMSHNWNQEKNLSLQTFFLLDHKGGPRRRMKKETASYSGPSPSQDPRLPRETLSVTKP